jgi:hypothetical protein
MGVTGYSRVARKMRDGRGLSEKLRTARRAASASSISAE